MVDDRDPDVMDFSSLTSLPNETAAALGHFQYAFSSLVAMMRLCISTLVSYAADRTVEIDALDLEDNGQLRRINSLLSDMDPLTIARHLRELVDAEPRLAEQSGLADRLYQEFEALNTYRNRLMHEHMSLADRSPAIAESANNKTRHDMTGLVEHSFDRSGINAMTVSCHEMFDELFHEVMLRAIPR